MMMQPSLPGQDVTLPVVVRSMTLLAKDTLAVEFMPQDGVTLPPFAAGAHVDLLLPNGIRRSYSLCNSPSDTGRYVVGVKKADPSRGASSYIHDTLRVGQVMKVSAPKNNFPLDETAAKSVLIAGGIGITPMMSMIDRLEAAGADWTLYFSCRTRADAAFLDRLDLLDKAHCVNLNFDGEPGGAILNLAEIIGAEQGEGVHFYACGPAPMLDAFEAATEGLPEGHAHLERFGGEPLPVSDDALETFEVECVQSGLSLTITPDTTILDALLDNGIDIPFSCMDGVCGSCRVGVVEGTPDHRDMVLSDGELSANKVMMVCCSGSRSPKLVLDI
ncbi:PDR/VanB family oxidoreductase [Maritimibacter sp. UBA3975]|uniref:PDR/VanB family oxidoreductase n=1 Tax=Maritimibacter sp. UBA3975 TaxID=1946833 RepID=UPI000C0BA2AC|nr:PDR/VanB family oxidoreductase [Maritimibacter sp. UBA3975]MAM59950.1 oxidoreductase [Maritimibacter sp.]|tara:strand:- start:46145 stop:47137 length:993 start_codon:yes stop_codon:yes gene_type:complete